MQQETCAGAQNRAILSKNTLWFSDKFELEASKKSMKSITESRYRAAVEEAAQWIDQSFTAPVRLADAADAACMSPYHFQRVFAAMIGETPGDYLRRRRIERSVRLLAATHYSVQAVASMSGFESASVLCHVMARTLGVSPLEFRRRQDATSLLGLRAQHAGPPTQPLPVIDPPLAVVYLEERYALLRMARGLKNRSFISTVSPQAVQDVLADYQALWPNTPLGTRFVLCPDETLAPDDPSERLFAGIMAPNDTPPAPMRKNLYLARMPAGWYVIFEQHGELRLTWQMWNRVARHSLAANGLQQRKAPRFEVLRDDPQRVRPHALRAHLYVPVYPANADAATRARCDEQDHDLLPQLRPQPGALFERLHEIERQAS